VLSAALGGAQSIHANGFDEALALPTERSAKLALRTQQVIAAESGICDTVDPVGGSWFVERLTADLESAAEALVAEIDARGGAVECIDFMRDAIHDAAYRYHQAVRDGTRPVVGLNAHVEDEEPPIEILRIDPAIERDQVARLGGLRARRDNALVQRLLGDVEAAARGDANLLCPMREALRAKATVGEVSGVLRVVFGEYDRLIATRG
jgi:methylmalonyl-CoA mutase N-terminal domain/subunit